MQQDDSYSDQIQFEDQYSPISLNDNDRQNDKFIGQKQFKQLQLSDKVKQFFKSFKKYSKKNFIKLFQFKEEVQQNKSVCAKNINSGQTIAECYDCATDSTCIQCMECFRNSNHEGHKVVIKRAGGGCCDCGDFQAWKKEGFCKNHTGQAVEVQIDPKEQSYFLAELRQIFFILFWQNAQQNTNSCKLFSKKIVETLSYLNQKGIYYSKLISLLFESKIPQQLVISKNVNNRTILANILNPKIAKDLDMDVWMDLFFSMFPYYPFKKLLLSTYMKNFTIIYDESQDSQGSIRGSSIACQLLTSYQLVRQYALQQGSIPIGSNLNIDKLNTFETTFIYLCHDMNYITKLQGDTPAIYFKFHLTNREGLLSLFQYRNIIKRQQNKHPQDPVIFQLTKFVKCFQIQFKVLETLSKAAGILKKDKQSLAFIIKILYEQALKQQYERKMIIFKPLTRALAIFIFAYFDFDLQRINLDSVSSDKFINEVIKTSSQQFSINLSKLFKVCVETFLFHSKILAQPGLNSTLYVYLYFYKMKTRFISSLDILAVKILSMMHAWSQIKAEPVISPQDYIWESSIATTPQARQQQLQRKLQHLQLVLTELNLVSASKSNELYVAYQVDSQCSLYKDYIQNLLLKLLNQQKMNFTLANAKQYEQAFFHPKVDLAQNYLRKFCSYDKSKKTFILSKQYDHNEGKAVESLNYSDFRCNLTNKTQFQSPQNTMNIIKGTYNVQAYEHLYSIQTIKKFVVKSTELMKSLILLNEQNNENPINLQKLKPLFAEILKTIYIKSKITSKPEQLTVVLEFLKKIDKIQEIINPFYNNLLYPQKKIIQESSNSPSNFQQRQSPEKIKEDEKKQKLKQKMEQKRKAIRQRYAKQLATFEQQEKNIIQLQEIQQQNQNNQKLNCIICKSDEQQNLIFLVKVSYKNHEKLLRLGEGVMCLSVLSCYHAIDYECYQKLQEKVTNHKKPKIKCPFCKFSTNTFLPVYAKSKHVPDALRKLEVSLFLQKNLDQVSVLEEIVKSFYHFSLLGYLDPQRTLHRRLRIYKIIFEILKQNAQLYDLKNVYQKFITNRMNMNPKILQDSNEAKREQQMMQLSMMLRNNGEDSASLQQLSESQVETLLQLLNNNQRQMSDQSQQSENSNPGFLLKTLNHLKSKIGLGKTKQKQDSSKKNRMTKIFKQTMKKLFKELNMKQMQIQNEQKQQQKHEQKQKRQQFQKMEIQPQNILSLNYKHQISQMSEEQRHNQNANIHFDEQVSPSIEICLKNLFDSKKSHQLHHHKSIYQDLTDSNNKFKLRDLPLNYRPLAKFNKCKCCQQITSEMTICLLCDWQGCLKRCKMVKQKKQKNAEQAMYNQAGSLNHSKLHGQQCLFLLLSTCQVYNICPQSGVSMGCIYKDEWGNDFHHKQEWQKFFLDEGELNKIKLKFLHQE